MDTHSPHPDMPHRRAWDAIPWVLAGTASDEEVRSVHAHLPTCADCQAEWALQTHVRAGLEAGIPAQWPDADAALQRLLVQLDDGAPAAQARPPAADGRAPAGGWNRWLVAAVLVQAVALGASGLAWLGAVPADYRTLSDTPAATDATSASARTTLRVVPAPGLDFAALQLLLAQAGLVVVETAPDGVHLGLAAADGTRASALAALPRLRAHPGVRLAEPTAAASVP